MPESMHLETASDDFYQIEGVTWGLVQNVLNGGVRLDSVSMKGPTFVVVISYSTVIT